MATNSTSATSADQIIKSLTVTVRVPVGSTGTLFEEAAERLSRIAAVTDLTVVETGPIKPRNGATYVTLAVDVVSSAPNGEALVENVTETVYVESVESGAVT